MHCIVPSKSERAHRNGRSHCCGCWCVLVVCRIRVSFFVQARDVANTKRCCKILSLFFVRFFDLSLKTFFYAFHGAKKYINLQLVVCARSAAAVFFPWLGWIVQQSKLFIAWVSRLASEVSIVAIVRSFCLQATSHSPRPFFLHSLDWIVLFFFIFIMHGSRYVCAVHVNA